MKGEDKMGNITNGIKKFLQNKNTVTVLGVVAAVLILFIGYNIRVKSAINPITVPYAKESIAGGTKITSDMIGTIEVPPSMLKGNVITDQGRIIDQYSRPDSMIPEGSLFYSAAVVSEEQLPANIIYSIPDGYVLYNMSVDTATTYGNSVYPENYIDIYLKAVNKLTSEESAAGNPDADKIMLGKLITNVKVLAVKDSNGDAVFADLDNKKTPSMIVFAVPEEYYILLKKAEYLRSYDSTLIPVPTNESLEENPGKIEIASDDLKAWINKVTVWTEG